MNARKYFRNPRFNDANSPNSGQKNPKSIFLFIIFFTLSIGGPFVMIHGSYALLSMDYVGSDYIHLRPTYDNFDFQGMAEKIIPVINSSGAFPTEGSSPELTYYGWKLNELLGNNSLDINSGLETFIISKFDLQTGGFSDDNLISLSNYYYALNLLHGLNSTIPEIIKENVSEFIEDCVVNKTYFIDIRGTFKTDLSIDMMGIALMELLDIPFDEYINPEQLYYYLVSNYHINDPTNALYPLFATSDSTKFEKTYYIGYILDKIGMFYDYKPSLINRTIECEQGTIISGDNASVNYIDSENMILESQSKRINITSSISMDLINNLYETKSIDFNFTLITEDLSSLDYVSADFYVYDYSENIWKSFASTNSLSSILVKGNADDKYSFKIEAGDMYFPNYTSNNVGDLPYSRILRFKASFSNLTDFNLTIDKFQYSYIAADGSEILNDIISRFVRGFFDSETLSENYFAARMLATFGRQNDLSNSDWQKLMDNLEVFSVSGGYAPTVYNSFDDIRSDYMAAFIHSMADFTSYSGNSTLEQFIEYIDKWLYPDGGFGGYKLCSLKSTYTALYMLNKSGDITEHIINAVYGFLNRCRNEQSTYYYHDLDDDSSLLEDSFYAVMIKQLIDSNYTITDDGALISDIISSQNPVGYFNIYNNIEDTYYALALIDLAGRVDDIQYRSELENYVINLQRYYGGFLSSPNDVEASMAATAFAVECAKILDIVGSIRMTQEIADKGVIEYYTVHQDYISGGFSEESFGFLSNESSEYADLWTTYLAVHSIYDFTLMARLNGTGLSSYIIGKIPDFNSFASVDINNTGSLQQFARQINEGFYIYGLYWLLKEATLNLDVMVLRDTVYPGENVAIKIDVSDNDGNLIEGCQIYIQSRGITYSLTDLQNGTYTGKIYYFDESSTNKIKVYCIHDEYFDFELDYNLEIYEPIIMKNLDKAKTQVGFLRNNVDLGVKIINQSSGLPIESCNVYLLNESGDLIYNLPYDNKSEAYHTEIPGNIWGVSVYRYYLGIEGGEVRPELFEVKAVIIPPMVLLYTLGALAVTFAVLMKVSPKFREEYYRTKEKTVKYVRTKILRVEGLHLTEADIIAKRRRREHLIKYYTPYGWAVLFKETLEKYKDRKKTLEEKDKNLREILGEEVYSEFSGFDLKTRVIILEKLAELKDKEPKKSDKKNVKDGPDKKGKSGSKKEGEK